MTSLNPEPIVTGRPHLVTAVGGHGPVTLDDFVGTTEFALDRGGTPYVVRGCGALDHERVRFHEKTAGLGKDVRTWYVTACDGHFEAEHAAAF